MEWSPSLTGHALGCSDIGVVVRSDWVLVVADDAAERMRLFRLLEREGYHATVADDVEAALALLRAEPFDLVLVALGSLDPDVYSLLKGMKGGQLRRPASAIVISGVAEPDSVARCLHLGVDDYLVEPADRTVLRARIATTLENRRLRERQAEYVKVMGQLARAVAAVRSRTVDVGALDPFVGRGGPLGDLARVFQEMASDVDLLRRDTTVWDGPGQ